MEGDRRYDDNAFLHQKSALVFLAFLGGKTGMVGQGGKPLSA